MEGRKSLVEELFPTRKTLEAAKNDSLSSLFPPYPTAPGKGSVHSDWRKTGAESRNSWVSPSGKNQSTTKKNSKHVNLYEFTESCHMSSSVHYGGRDDFITDTSGDYKSEMHCNYKNKEEDDSVNSEVAMRGDWWQGSFYY